MENSNKQYLYYAFISYRRTDTKYAKWLQKKLQNYRLPAKIKNASDADRISLSGEAAAPDRLSPIFRDQTDLVPGKLGDSLTGALAKSRYLIVLCSKNAAQNSTYLDLEIRSFLESGHSPEQIIPLIIDTDCAHPEVECFPAELRALNEQYELLGASIGDSGKNDAFLKIVATMLGVQMAELKNLDDLRRRRNRIAASLATAAVLAVCVFAGIYAWQHLITHTMYYENYIVVNNIAVGISELDSKDLSDYTRYYRFTVLDGKVREVEYLNYAGALRPPTATVFNDGAARFVYTYTESGALYTASYYSYQGLLLTCYQYSEDMTHVMLLQDTSSGEAGFSWSSVSEAGTIYANRTSISKYIQTYDEDGRLLTRVFAYGDNYTPCADEDHIFGYALSYDNQGNLTAMSYIGTADGDLTGSIDGVYAISYTRDADTGQVLTETLHDRNGSTVDGSEGWAYKVYTYTDSDAVESICYYNSLQNPVLCPDGYAQIAYSFSGAVCVGEAYFDAEGNPVACTGGYASMQCEANETGEIIHRTYLDAEGNPVADTDGVYGYTTDVISDTEYIITYLDADGTPLENADGYAIQHIYTDEYSCKLQVYYFDSNGDPCTEHYASYTYVYDDTAYHNLLERHFFDEEGNPMIVQVTSDFAGASLIMEYNSMGIQTSLRMLDENGDLYDGPGGYASFSHSYENNGGIITETLYYYGSDSNPVVRDFLGACGIKWVCDEAGRVTEGWYLGADGELMLNEIDGYAGIRFTYDEYDQVSSVTYLNELSLPMPINGVARICVTYDAYGNALSKWNYGTDLLPVVAESDGYAGVECTYDESGNLLSTWYFGADEQLMLNETEGYAGKECTHDESGNCLSVWYYGTDEQPMINEAFGYAGMEWTYDESGNLLSAWYYGTDEQPMINEVIGYAGMEWTYDEFGNLLSVRYFGANEQPMIQYTYDDSGNLLSIRYYGADEQTDGYASEEDTYDESGNLLSVRYFGANEQPMVQYTYDDSGNLLSIRYYGADEQTDGYASEEITYDASGRPVSTWYYSADEQLMVNEAVGYAGVTFEYDIYGNNCAMWYYGTDGLPIAVGRAGFAGVEFEYNEDGDVIKTSIYGAENGEFVLLQEYE